MYKKLEASAAILLCFYYFSKRNLAGLVLYAQPFSKLCTLLATSPILCLIHIAVVVVLEFVEHCATFGWEGQQI